LPRAVVNDCLSVFIVKVLILIDLVK